MSIKSIAIEVTDNAFLPEKHAYLEFFRNCGYECELIMKGSLEILNYDAVLLFHGFHPFWKKYPKYIIGEYHSLSVGRNNRLKDIVKRLINVRSDLYIFLNEDVRRKMWFSKSVNYITRSMGFNKFEFSRSENQKKEFDIVYCGSYRLGLTSVLVKLANMGLTIALVGPEYTLEHDNIIVFGRKPPNDARAIIAKSKYGLNYTPDVFPLNIQDSTKVIEYCAAKIGVITNRYQWIDKFEAIRDARFLTLDSIESRYDLDSFEFRVPCVDDLDWNSLINRAGLASKIEGIAS